MANLVEVESFDEGVYRIETTDQVLGGETGTTNKPLKNLTNRTNWLKARWVEMVASITPITATISGLKTASTKDANATKVAGQVPLWESVYSVAQVDAMLAAAGLRLASGTQTIGDIDTGGKSVTVPLGRTLDNSNYMVFGSVVSKGTALIDTTVTWAIESKGNTSFVVRFQEWNTGVQIIDFDWEIKAK